MKKWLPILTLVFVMMFASCASKKDIVYFQGSAELQTVSVLSVPKIQPNDMLSINVSAADIKAAQVFNQQSPLPASGGETNGAGQQNVYIVEQDGSIDYPVLGKINLGGLTRQQAVDVFKTKLNEYIVNPGVNISFTNFRVSVIGEVKSPGTFTVSTDRITILEALALAGDLSIQGKRKNVMLIREVNGVKQIHTIDLTNKETLNSPLYYLAQNDVVYVEPNKSMIQSSVVNYSLFISVAGIIISVLAVLSK